MNNLHRQFQGKILNFYSNNKRNFSWRETTDPYKILVSEIMLQQTQTQRVITKYEEFLKTFPTLETLAQSSTQILLTAWQGLGYNRRALYLKKIAEIVMHEYNGILPKSSNELLKLPGIGKNTAGSIMAFAYNAPSVFIETNIRRVFIHEFFYDKTDIHDTEILTLIKQTLPRENIREWYYALMDYGAYIAKQVPNPNRKSRHYTKQSKFEGSLRQIRGKILKILIEKPQKTVHLFHLLNSPHTENAVKQLLSEGFIEEENGYLSIPY